MANFIDPLGNCEVQRALCFARARERYSWVERETLLGCCEAAWEAALRGDAAAGGLVERFDRSLTLLAWTHGWTRRPADLTSIRDQTIPLEVLRPFMAEGDARTRLERLADPVPEPVPVRRERSLVPRIPFVSPVPVAAAAVAGLAVVAGLGKSGAVKVGPLAPSGHAEDQQQTSAADRHEAAAGGGGASTSGAGDALADNAGGGPVGDWFSERARAVERITRQAVDRVRQENAVVAERQTAGAGPAPAAESAPVHAARPAPAPPAELVSARAESPAPARSAPVGPPEPATPSLRPDRGEDGPARAELPHFPTEHSEDEGRGEDGSRGGGPWDDRETSTPPGLPGDDAPGRTSLPEPAGAPTPDGWHRGPGFPTDPAGPGETAPTPVGPAPTKPASTQPLPAPAQPEPGPAGPQAGPGQPQQAGPGQPQQADPGHPQQADPGQPQQADPGQPQQADPGQPQAPNKGQADLAKPKPGQSSPSKPAPARPGGAKPAPGGSGPAKPAPAKPGPAQSAPGKAAPAQPGPGKAAPAQPGPAAAKPAAAKPAAGAAGQAPKAAAPAAPAPAPAKPAPASSPAPQQAPAAPGA